jgi:type IX secretion system PorP/SprF family membrane protein
MKRILSIVALITVVYSASAQQLYTSSLYEMQSLLHNPGTAGLFQDNMIGASYRSQWSGISGSPRTAMVFGSYNLKKENAGISGYLFTDQTGPTSRTGLSASFAKHLKMKDGSVWSVGIEARALQFGIDRAKLSATLGADPALGNAENRFKFDAGLGVAYQKNNLRLGASVSQLVQSKLGFYNGTTTLAEEARLYRHYYFHGSYSWNVDESTEITPNFLVIYLPNAPNEIQGGVKVEHKELFWWGLSFRAKQSAILSAGVHIQKRFSFGYSFDIYRTPLSLFDSGSNAHELMLRLLLKK